MKKALLTALSLCLAAVAAEVVLRYHSPYILREDASGASGNVRQGDYSFFHDSVNGRRLIPNSHVTIINHTRSGRDVRIDINSHGFRSRELAPDKAENETRILVLGDSITLADERPLEEAYVTAIETNLNQQLTDIDVVVVNGGIDGIGIKDQLDILEDQGLKIQPDIVVVSFYLNDGNPPDRTAAVLGNPGFLRRHSVLAQTVFRIYKLNIAPSKEASGGMYEWLRYEVPESLWDDRDSFLAFAEVARRDWGASWKDETWVKIETQMKRLKALATEHNFEAVMVVFPVSFQVYTTFVEDAPQRRMSELSQAYGFSYLDLLPIHRARRDTSNIFTDWCHLATEGHQIVGKAIADHIHKNILTE